MMTATPYEALVESAARLTDTNTLADISDDDVSLASGFLHRNRLALESARRALGPQCVVPLRYEKSFFSEHCDHFSRLRNLARAFRVEALLAASNKNYGDVARIGTDILELANAVRRGGLITDLQVGVAISGIAMDNLRKIRTRLDDATSLLLIQDIQRIESERDPFSDIATRDHEWEKAVGCADAPCDFKSLELSGPEECGLSEEEQKEILDVLQQIHASLLASSIPSCLSRLIG